MGHRYTRTPDHSLRQKSRTEKNKLKPVKSKKFAGEKVKERKLKVKEGKRQKYLLKVKGKEVINNLAKKNAI